MKIQRNCIVCILNQILRVCDYLALDGSVRDRILKKALEYSARYDYMNLTAPECAGILYGIVIEETGQTDPYAVLKKDQNDLILDRESYFKNRISKSNDPLGTAAKLSLAGNIIDYGGVEKFSFDPDRLDRIQIDIDEVDQFKQKLASAKSLLYIADNAGEAVFDKLFIEEMRRQYPELNIRYSVKSAPAINDIVLRDAVYIGIDKLVPVIESGMKIAGTIIRHTTPEFQELYQDADIVISKGQGNFETLDEEVNAREILFIFKVKCQTVALHSGIPLGSNIFAFNHSLMKNRSHSDRTD